MTQILYYCFLDDHSRVILSALNNDITTTYINASYIDVSYFVFLLFIYFCKNDNCQVEDLTPLQLSCDK